MSIENHVASVIWLLKIQNIAGKCFHFLVSSLLLFQEAQFSRIRMTSSLKFNFSLGLSPQTDSKSPLLIVGNIKFLKCLKFEDLLVKLQPHVTKEVCVNQSEKDYIYFYYYTSNTSHRFSI